MPKAKKTTRINALATLEKLNGPLTFERLIESIRVTDGYTYASLGKKLGVSRAFVCDVAKGRRAIGIDRAAAWADALGYSPAQFVRLAIQAELDAAKLKFRVSVEAA